MRNALRGSRWLQLVAASLGWPSLALIAFGALGNVLACGSGAADGVGEPVLTEEPCDVEGATEACYPGPPATRGVGACVDGSHRCVTGRWTACEGAVVPAEETCGDAIDENCDGAPDEGCPCVEGATRDCYAGPPTTRGVGECEVGVQACDGDVWEPVCSGQVMPTAEMCNGADDDCNGAADDCPQPGGCPGCDEASYCEAGGCVRYECAWQVGDWGACSPSCGPGTQVRTVQCVCNADVVVADAYCEAPREADSRSCDLGPCCDDSCPSHDACGTNDCGNSCGPTCPPYGSYSTTCRNNRCVWEMGCSSGLPCNTTCYWGESTCVGTSMGTCSSCVDADNQRCYCWPNP